LDAVNVRAPFAVVAAFAPGIAPRGTGSIINSGSMAGRIGLAEGAAYGTTKAALGLLAQAWAAGYSPRGVRVNTVAGGPMYTRPAPVRYDARSANWSTRPSPATAGSPPPSRTPAAKASLAW